VSRRTLTSETRLGPVLIGQYTRVNVYWPITRFLRSLTLKFYGLVSIILDIQYVFCLRRDRISSVRENRLYFGENSPELFTFCFPEKKTYCIWYTYEISTKMKNFQGQNRFFFTKKMVWQLKTSRNDQDMMAI
jgi:hypothetical protein